MENSIFNKKKINLISCIMIANFNCHLPQNRIKILKNNNNLINDA